MLGPHHGDKPWSRKSPDKRMDRTGTTSAAGGGISAALNQGIGESQMIVTTMDGIAGRITEETLGVVRGTTLWTRRVIKSSYGGIRNFEVTGLQQMDQGLNDAKDQAHKTMVEQAKGMGADSVVGVKIEVAEMSNGVFCVNITGTAVKTLKLPASVPSFEVNPPVERDMVFEMDFDMSYLAARPAYEGSTLRH